MTTMIQTQPRKQLTVNFTPQQSEKISYPINQTPEDRENILIQKLAWERHQENMQRSLLRRLQAAEDSHNLVLIEQLKNEYLELFPDLYIRRR